MAAPSPEAPVVASMAAPSPEAPVVADAAARDGARAAVDRLVGAVEARSLATTTVRTFPNWDVGHHWTEDPRVMPTYEARSEAQALLRRESYGKYKSVEIEQAYLGLYLGLWPSDGSRYVSFLSRMLAVPGARKSLLATRPPRPRAAPRAAPPRRDSPPTPRRRDSRGAGRRLRATTPERPPAPPKERHLRALSTYASFGAVDAHAGRRAARRSQRARGADAAVWAPCGATLTRGCYVARGAAVCISTGEGSAGTSVVVDGRYAYSVAAAGAARPLLDVLAAGYKDREIVDSYVASIRGDSQLQALVVALREGRKPEPVAVALLSASCKHGRPGCACGHLGLWAIVTPPALRGRGHARRLGAAIRAHAAHHDNNFVHAYPQSKDMFALFHRFGFTHRGPSQLNSVPQPARGLNLLVADASSPYADSESESSEDESSESSDSESDSLSATSLTRSDDNRPAKRARSDPRLRAL